MQWTDPQQVINWFNCIENKNSMQFIKFDVKEFYPSITEQLLEKAIRFGQKHCDISQQDIKIIFNAAQSVLYHNEEAWIKRKEGVSPTFDITMGGYHGAEVCELVGLYMLSEMGQFIPKEDVGLYRDDGLMVIKRQSGRKTEVLKQKLHTFAKSIGLGLEIEGPMEKTDFLDISLDLGRETYAPYRKDNNNIKYINVRSNHPNNITKQIPKMIAKRITKRSIDEREFNKVAEEYNRALEMSGYEEKIKYEPETNIENKRKRKRKVIWYNPPYCKTVKTKLAKQFINLIKTCFTKENPLHKIFNKNSINLSYSCLPNIGNIINSHNRKILQKSNANTAQACNCKKFECPVKDQKLTCRTESVIYEATVKAEDNSEEEKTYIGLTGMEFKQRHYQHRHDFQNENKRESTELSKHIWKLKDKNINYNIRWKIIKQVPKIKNGNQMCRLCITEAAIIMKSKIGRLNKRTEVMNKCRHTNKFLLKNWKSEKEKKTINLNKTRKK